MSSETLDKIAVDVDDPRVSASLHVADIAHKPAWYYVWERNRPEWLQESVAEFCGVFLYCYLGFGATAANAVGQFKDKPFLGSLFTIGLAYAIGIAFSITIFATSSGGHLNPAVTVAFAIWKGFPWRKVPRYIVCQIAGAFAATLLVYIHYRPYIMEMEAVLLGAGMEAEIFTVDGPAGIFAIYPNKGASLVFTFLTEFVVDFCVGVIIWGVLDPANIFVVNSTIPVIIGLIFGALGWAFGPTVISANPARDFGARLGVTAIWGTRAFTGHYPFIAALTPILSTVIGATAYELFLNDSSRVVTRSHREFIANGVRHMEYKARKYNREMNRPREVTVISFNKPMHEHIEIGKPVV